MRHRKSVARTDVSPPIDEPDAKVVDICSDRTALNETTGRMLQNGSVVFVHEIGGIEIDGPCGVL
jgi:hypothetical protein